MHCIILIRIYIQKNFSTYRHIYTIFYSSVNNPEAKGERKLELLEKFFFFCWKQKKKFGKKGLSNKWIINQHHYVCVPRIRKRKNNYKINRMTPVNNSITLLYHQFWIWTSHTHKHWQTHPQTIYRQTQIHPKHSLPECCLIKNVVLVHLNICI